jgi:hypothetical protein
MASFTKLNNLSNELEQKRIKWFKEEGQPGSVGAASPRQYE